MRTDIQEGCWRCQLSSRISTARYLTEFEGLTTKRNSRFHHLYNLHLTTVHRTFGCSFSKSWLQMVVCLSFLTWCRKDTACFLKSFPRMMFSWILIRLLQTTHIGWFRSSSDWKCRLLLHPVVYFERKRWWDVSLLLERVANIFPKMLQGWRLVI